MGISKQVFEKTRGYKLTRMGEDIEFSIRVINSGFKTALIESAFVYHKRRTSLSQFYKQLHFFGRARVNINRFFPGELKLIHLLPTFFTIGIFIWLSTFLWMPTLFSTGGALVALFFLSIMLHATAQTRNVQVGFMSICTAFIQLFAYGMGMMAEKINPRGNQPFAQK